MKKTIFSTYHPAVIFVFLLTAIVFAFCTVQPMYVAITFVASSALYIMIKGFHEYLKSLKWYVIIWAVVSIANFLFVRSGTTVLYQMGYNKFTLEALCYGMAGGGMLVSVFIWFSCWNDIMENDKFLFLFSRIMPAISLIMSMIFRFIPDIITKGRMITDSQTALLGSAETSRKEKTAQGIRMASVLMGISLENSIETADSMRARGYGSSGKRTSYANYRWERHDIIAMVLLVVLIALNAFLMYAASSQFEFYPTMPKLILAWWGYIPYLVMLLIPLFVEGKAHFHEGR